MTGIATFVIAGLLALAATYSHHLGQVAAQGRAASAATAASRAGKLTRAEFEAEGGTPVQIAKPAPRPASN